MKKKPQIDYSLIRKTFIKDGVAITDQEAREIWDNISGSWATLAYQEMVRRVMVPNSKS